MMWPFRMSTSNACAARAVWATQTSTSINTVTLILMFQPARKKS